MEKQFKDISFGVTSIIRKHPRANYTYSSLNAILFLYYSRNNKLEDNLSKEVNDWIFTQYYDSELISDVFQKLDSYNLNIDEIKNLIIWSIDNNSRRGNERTESTNGSLIELIARLLDIKNNDYIFDAGSGNGEVLLGLNNYAKNNNNVISLHGIEIDHGLYLTSKILLFLQNIDSSIECADVLYKDTIIPMFDKGYCFPPFGGRVYNPNFYNNEENEYSHLFNGKSDAEWIFLFKMLKSMNDGGKIVLSVHPGLLYRFSSKNIHKYLIDNNLIEGIINLPRGLYTTMFLPTTLIVISRENEYIKYFDGSDMTVNIDDRDYPAIDVDRIIDNYFSNNNNTVDYKTIIENDFRLNPEYYFGCEKPEILHSTPIANIATIDKGSQYTISRFKDSISKKPTNYQLLTSSDIQANGIVDYNTLTYVKDDPKLLKFALKENDIVVTTKSTRVKTFVAKDLPKRNIIVTGGMLVIHPNTELVDPVFLKMFLDSETGSKILSSIMRGITIKTISFKDFQNINVSCPPLEEQNELAKKYNRLVAMHDGIKEQLNEMQNEIASFYENNIRRD